MLEDILRRIGNSIVVESDVTRDKITILFDRKQQRTMPRSLKKAIKDICRKEVDVSVEIHYKIGDTRFHESRDVDTMLRTITISVKRGETL